MPGSRSASERFSHLMILSALVVSLSACGSSQPRRLTQHSPWIPQPSESERNAREAAGTVLSAAFTVLETGAWFNPYLLAAYVPIAATISLFRLMDDSPSNSGNSGTERYCAVQLSGEPDFHMLNRPMQDDETVAAFTSRMQQEGILAGAPENISCSSYWP